MFSQKEVFNVKGIQYIIRSAEEKDAKELAAVRLQIDGETENLDRERGEGFIDEEGFKQRIQTDTEHPKNLFLVAEIDGRIVGFSRCEGTNLKRLSHKVEFGVCVLKDYWGLAIGKNLLEVSINWADSHDIRKMVLSVLETNEKAIKLYESYNFEVEGIVKKDKKLSDGKFYSTILMGRFKE
ncbi:GNAT family N-acetyltransferase [Chungangia koreensis]|uniref:GNAT family N-acetyltransferase n=1 Tax=Chungangia koreensis TaxID=752657 RepID=A0ABV8X143_9LACT